MSQPPRGPRNADRLGRPGTLPPVPGRPTSWPLLTLATLLLLTALSVLTWQVLTDGPLRAADERLGDTLRDGAPPTWAAELLADLGNMTVAPSLLLAAMAYAVLRTRRWWPALCYSLALALVPAVVSTLKAWTDRPGPLGGTGYFPSGHAATAAVAFGAAALLITHAPSLNGPRDRTSGEGEGGGIGEAEGAGEGGDGALARPWSARWALGRARAAWLLTAAVLTLANGLGLVWRGYHWPLDVLASWCLSVLLLLWTARAAAVRPEPPLSGRRRRAVRDRE
ncbi:phosphatase PAP2 family protein [Streptomyces albiaxialis]|uniref:phosphatase PAP2 family protein n=1 Tax=Streptomyces albiaxialis TaxID=329523 RepID=UPI0031CE09BB